MKKIAILLFVLLVAAGCTDNTAVNTPEEIQFISKSQPIEIPYGKKVDILGNEVIVETNGHVFVEIGLNVFRSGEQSVTYFVRKGEMQKEFKVDFLILEAKNPVVEFEEYLPEATYYNCHTSHHYYEAVTEDNYHFTLSGDDVERIENPEDYFNDINERRKGGLYLSLRDGTSYTYTPIVHADVPSFVVLENGIYYFDASNKNISDIEKRILYGNFEDVEYICAYDFTK